MTISLDSVTLSAGDEKRQRVKRAFGRAGHFLWQMACNPLTAIGGANISQTVEGRERYPINVRYAREFRDRPDLLGSGVTVRADLPREIGPATTRSALTSTRTAPRPAAHSRWLTGDRPLDGL